MMNRASPVDMRKALEIEKRNSLCECKDRDIKDCEGAWEEGCDLGKNEKFASPAPDVPLTHNTSNKRTHPL